MLYGVFTNPKQRLDLLQSLVVQVRKREFPYEARVEKATDWSGYTTAQIHELNDMVLAIRQSVETAAQRLPRGRRGRGRPGVNVVDVAKAVLLQQYFGTANRQTEGLLLLLKEKLGLEETFSYKTIERAYENPRVVQILERLFDLTTAHIHHVEEGLGVDATGLPKSLKKNYESQKTPDGAEMAQFTIGLRTQLLTRITLLKGRHETVTFPQALEGAEHYPNLRRVVGDAAYLSRDNCTLVDALNAQPYFFPRRGITFKRLGSDAWVRMLTHFTQETQAWLREYHARSLTETVNSVWKRDYPIPLRRRVSRRRDTEILARGIDYNLKRGGYLRHLEGLRPAWSEAAA